MMVLEPTTIEEAAAAAMEASQPMEEDEVASRPSYAPLSAADMAVSGSRGQGSHCFTGQALA